MNGTHTSAHRIRLFDDLVADVRFGARALRRTPLFTAVAVLTIALGIGANAAIFGVIDAVLLRTLPVRAPERLAFVNVVGRLGQHFGGPPYPWVEEIRARNTSFDDMAVFATDHVPVVVDGRVEQVLGQIASGAYFETLGVRAVVGRTLSPDDERLSPPVAVIGYGYWQHRFGGRRDIVGTVIRYQDQALTIVGVTPREFDGLQTGQRVDITFPVTMAGFDLLRDTGAWWSTTVARVRQGVPFGQAQRDVNTIFSSLDVGSSGAEAPRRRVELVPASRGLDRLRRQLEAPLLLVLGAVGAVLLIACANIANLLSVRAASRRRELAVRSALGAGRGRLVRHLLTESVLLFTLGAVAGLVVAKGVHRALEGYLAVGRMPITLDLTLNARVLGMAATLTLVAAMLSGLAPAWRAGSRQGNGFMDLRLAGRTAGVASPTSRWLVVVQLAVSVVVLVGGSLLLRTLMNLRSVDLGFRAEGVLTLSVQPLESAYPAERRAQVFTDVLERVGQLPGVESASLSVLTPLSGRDRGRGVVIPGRVPRAGVDNDVHVNYVSPGYFETFGIPVTLGRPFALADDARAPKVALMNAAAAKLYFDARPALGTPLGFEPADDPPRSYMLVGVTGNSRHLSVRDPAPRFVYLPISQVPDSPSRLTLAVRTRTALPVMGDIVRREIERVGGDILVSDVETVSQQVDRALLRERLTSTLSVAFAALGLLLAALGLYGVAAYAVIARTPEIGIRMALGSTPGAVQWLMLRQALTMGAVGVAIGLPLGVGVALAIRRLLYGVAPTDPIIVATCVAILFAVTALAGYLPARRASRIDPVRALATQ
jgi:predicted permease